MGAGTGPIIFRVRCLLRVHRKEGVHRKERVFTGELQSGMKLGLLSNQPQYTPTCKSIMTVQLKRRG